MAGEVEMDAAPGVNAGPKTASAESPVNGARKRSRKRSAQARAPPGQARRGRIACAKVPNEKRHLKAKGMGDPPKGIRQTKRAARLNSNRAARCDFRIQS